MDPSQFYTGLVADLYAPLKSMSNNPVPYARFIARSGQPALELGCGDGERLLDLVAQGLDVEGVDSSRDMLERCRLNATKRGVDVTLHHQSIESLSLSRRYRSMFLAGGDLQSVVRNETISPGNRQRSFDTNASTISW